MRAHSLHLAARLGTMMALTGGLVLTATPASAEEGGVHVSSGSAAIKYEETRGLPTSIQTGWIGPDLVQINVGIKLDPVVKGGPLFTVDMPKGANVEASWGTDKKILLKAQTGSQSDGLVTVRHTLTPAADIKISGFGLSATFTYDANKLLNLLPGARFAYDSKAQQAFAPWGFTPVATKLNAPDVAASTLFSLDMASLPDFVSDKVTGFFGVRASTKPTFSYRTTKVVFAGTDGELKDATGELSVPAADGDYMEIMTAVEGEMSVKGGIGIQPFVHIDTIGKNKVDADLGYDVYTKDYTVDPKLVPFQAALVHIPMPNVRVPSKGIDLGDVKTGGTAKKTVVIENTGELEATMSFTSSVGAFKVPGGSVVVPAKGKHELTVTYASESASPASTTITVASSDADAPKQTFKIGANGADVGAEDESSGTRRSAAEDSGCGCKAAGTPVGSSGWAGLALAALGAVVLVRRRRDAA